jgi:molybdopterin synthase sulfur carrier subunit
MQLKFKLYAGLSRYLPSGAEGNTFQLEVSEETTANNIIDKFNVPRDLAHLVLLNGIYLKPEQRDQPVFNDGDTLAIWPPVAGG